MDETQAETQRATPEERFYGTLNEVALEISSKLDAHLLDEAARRNRLDPADHSASNWASEIHHPCRKFLVHCRADWRQRKMMGIDGRWRVKEGEDEEWDVKRLMGNIGFELTKSQRKFTTDDPGLERYGHLKISGRIDGLAPLNRSLPEPFGKLREIPAEIKSIAPHYWNSTRTVEDLKRHHKFWIQKIPSQLNTYCVFRDWPGGLLILTTFGKKPRIIPMLFDPDLWDYDRRTVEEVNSHVDAGTYPNPMPFDPAICGLCDFDHICQPIKATRMVGITDADAIRLEFYLDLKEWKERFEEMHAELIGNKKNPGTYHGVDAIVNDIEIKTRRYMRKLHDIPPEEKAKYHVGDEEVVVTTIERIAP